MKKRESLYVRRCEMCSNFHNWKVLPDGSAICGNCGHRHPPPRRYQSTERPTEIPEERDFRTYE